MARKSTSLSDTSRGSRRAWPRRFRCRSERSSSARLREINRQLGIRHANATSRQRIFELDLEFHRSFVEEVAGPRLLTLHRAIKPQSERYSRLYISVLLDELTSSVSEHQGIISAIHRGDPAAAQLATEMNWDNAARRLVHLIALNGERGIWAS